MGIITDTKAYATEVAETALNAFDRQARGTLEAPNGDDNVRLYTAKGGSAITLANNVVTASVVYDPEASLRNGQMNVVSYGRDSSGVVIDVQRVNLGRPTSEFLSAGLLSSGLKVFNSSGVDVIGGTQTAAVLSSVPRDISTITSTDVANFCPNHDRDLASGVISREDSTMTMSMTEHFGKKMALTRTNTSSNMVERSWDQGVGSRRSISGQSMSPIVDTAITVGASVPSDAAVIADATKHVVDSSRLDDGNNPLSLACYRAKVETNITLGDPNSAAAGQEVTLKAYALDAANNIIVVNTQNTRVDRVDNVSVSTGLISMEVSSTTVPITRVIIAVTSTFADATLDTFVTLGSTAKLYAYEETSDIPTRPIHVCVIEGVNANATININSVAVLTGVPDSTNVFIGTSMTGDSNVYDTNAVEIFLKSVVRSMPRAFTIAGHGSVTKSLTAMYGGEEIELAFQAMSFGDVTKAVKRLSAKAKHTAAQVAKLVDEAEPAIRTTGSVLEQLPGATGLIGRSMVAGSDAMRRMR